MPIDRIPILSENYPLFDWDDHQMSYYALGEGELVSGFQKETWNEIIDQTLAALRAAGMQWDSKYTTAAGAKVTEAYGALSAKMFNSVRHNIDRPAPVGWGWAYNPALRGYVGREDFKGYGDYGLQGDLFYAEYLLELVRRLNLMLEIMRGTANLKEMDAPILSQTEAVHNLLALPSAPMKFSKPAFSSFICGLMANRAGQFSAKEKSRTKDEVTLGIFRSKRLQGQHRSISRQQAQLLMPAVKKTSLFTDNTPSISQAIMDVFNALYLSSALGTAQSSTKTALSAPSLHRMQAQEIGKTKTETTVAALSPKPIWALAHSKTKSAGAVNAPQAASLTGAELVKSDVVTVFEKIRPRRMSGKETAGVACIAILDSAWLAPIWVNGKLYIRQAYETKTTETALEVI